MSDYLDKTYDETFDSVFANMTYRKENDPDFTKQHLKDLLESLYVHQGNNWVGRSEIKELINTATIAACEAVLYDWE